jgi:hypothetical protein
VQEDVLQLFVRVAVRGGVLCQHADGGDQRERKLRQRPVELRERLRNLGGGASMQSNHAWGETE